MINIINIINIITLNYYGIIVGKLQQITMNVVIYAGNSTISMRQMVITVLASLMLAGGTPEENIIGVWETQRGDSKIEIYRTPDGTFSGKIIWAESPHESYVGTIVMKGVKYKDGEYTCPWIYDPRMEITAHAKITLSGDTMNVKATKGIISKREVFIRKSEMASGK